MTFTNFTTGQNGKSIRDGYAGFLQQFPFDFFITQTFARERDDLTPCNYYHPVMTGIRRDGDYAAREWYEGMEKFGITRAFVAVEKHHLDGVHLHILAAFDAAEMVRPGRGVWDAVRKYSLKRWGRVKIENPKRETSVASYCTKYVTKAESGGGFSFHGDPYEWQINH